LLTLLSGLVVVFKLQVCTSFPYRTVHPRVQITSFVCVLASEPVCSSLLFCLISTFRLSVTLRHCDHTIATATFRDFRDYDLSSFPTVTISCRDYKPRYTRALGRLQRRLVPLLYFSLHFPTPFLGWLETLTTRTPQTILHLLFRFDCALIPQQDVSVWPSTKWSKSIGPTGSKMRWCTRHRYGTVFVHFHAFSCFYAFSHICTLSCFRAFSHFVAHSRAFLRFPALCHIIPMPVLIHSTALDHLFSTVSQDMDCWGPSQPVVILTFLYSSPLLLGVSH